MTHEVCGKRRNKNNNVDNHRCCDNHKSHKVEDHGIYNDNNDNNENQLVLERSTQPQQ